MSEVGTLAEAWEREASAWAEWATALGHDHYYWRFDRPALLALLPPPGRRTLDLGCGEGRLARELTELGHEVVGVDASGTLIEAARAHGSATFVHGDAACLPFAPASFDLVVSNLALQDLDDLEGAVKEAARVLEADGLFGFSIVHPFKSAGRFEGSGFTLTEPYFRERRTIDRAGHDGRSVTLHGVHRPLQAYTEALAAAGLLVERMVEPTPPADLVQEREEVGRWLGVPCFLHIRAVKRPRTGRGR